MKLLLFISSFVLLMPVNAQVYHTDPYKIDNYLYYDNEFNKQEVTINKIKKVSVFEYQLKNNKIIGKTQTLKYFIEFNANGNPAHYYSRYTYGVWWWYAFLQAIKLNKKRVDTHDYYFEYDSGGKLIHAKELLTSTTSPSKDINEVSYEYDSRGNLVEEQIAMKTIYRDGYRYRGTRYGNSINQIKYEFSYDENRKIKTIIQSRSDLAIWDSTKQTDTIPYHSTFDSLFVKSEVAKGIKTDSLGRIIEFTHYATYAKPMSGPCINPDSPNDRINKMFYNDDGKLVKCETYLRSGEFVSRDLIIYGRNGLPVSSRLENSNLIICYQYEYY